MQARLIGRLEAEIARAEGVFERECLKARRAAALARHGQLAEARFALAGLRSQSQRLRHPVLRTWVDLVDGLIDHCASLSPGSRDKFRRAYNRAVRAEEAALQAECAAWLAVADFNANDVDAMVRHVCEALRLAPPDAHGALARASLVAADAYRYAGDEATAQPWYQRVRRHASVEGDGSIVSMLLHNSAAFRVGHISLEHAFGRGDIEEAQRVLLEAESTGNYDAGVGNAQLLALVPLLRAQLLAVLGRHDAAISLIDAQLPLVRGDGQAHREARWVADAAYCEVRLNRRDEAHRRLRSIAPLLALITEADDLAAVHARLACVMRALDQQAHAETHEAAAQDALRRHRQEQLRWLAALQGMAPMPAPA